MAVPGILQTGDGQKQVTNTITTHQFEPWTQHSYWDKLGSLQATLFHHTISDEIHNRVSSMVQLAFKRNETNFFLWAKKGRPAKIFICECRKCHASCKYEWTKDTPAEGQGEAVLWFLAFLSRLDYGTKLSVADMDVPCCARRAWDVQEPNGQIQDTSARDDVDMEASHPQDEDWQEEGYDHEEWGQGEEEEAHVEGHDTGAMSDVHEGFLP